ncbi:pacearchaeosortase, partial [Candidatus Pacearchaeota archaeon]
MKAFGVFLRYFFLLVVGLNLDKLYSFLTWATVNSLGLIFSIYTKPLIVRNYIRLPGLVIQVIPACVAASAFFLLIFLFFSTPMKPEKRLKVLAFSILALFVINLARIVFLVEFSGSKYFDAVHWFFWNFLSTVFVVALYIASYKI